jgi:hypothetical protein
MITVLVAVAAVLLSAQASREQARIAEAGQVTDRFIRAVEQLGSDQPDVAIGGMYSLERIARDSDVDRSVVQEVLAAYVRNHAQNPNQQTPLPQVQSALDILGRMPASDQGPDLHGTRLAGADLSGADFYRAVFTDAVLTYADLSHTKLTRANLIGADLSRTNLAGVDLIRADLTHADLTTAFLLGSDLTHADLTDANLTDTDLRNVDFIDADLSSANLTRANLIGADLTRADLLGADLSRANLLDANLTDADLRATNLDGACPRSAFTQHPETERQIGTIEERCLQMAGRPAVRPEASSGP